MVRAVVPPTGTVTFLFTDVEASTRRWERDAAGAEELLADHDALIAEVVSRHGGYVFARLGDGVAVAFARASDAVAAAVEAQQAFGSERFALEGFRVRMGAHTGETVERAGDYFGPVVNRAARLMAAGHGGQVLVSSVTAALVQGGVMTIDLGEQRLRDLERREHVYQVCAPGLRSEFPPLLASHDTPNNLAAPLTSFVGREAELRRLIAVVPTARLVTLVGTGGVGKTRLAIESARGLFAQFPGGVWLAELASIGDGSLVAATLARATARHDPLAAAAGAAGVLDQLAFAIGEPTPPEGSTCQAATGVETSGGYRGLTWHMAHSLDNGTFAAVRDIQVEDLIFATRRRCVRHRVLLMAVQTRSAVQGMSMWLTLRCETASTPHSGSLAWNRGCPTRRCPCRREGCADCRSVCSTSRSCTARPQTPPVNLRWRRHVLS